MRPPPICAIIGGAQSSSVRNDEENIVSMSTWMIVEDEPDIHDMLLLMTHTLAHTGLAFINGEEAMFWIDDYDLAPDRRTRPQMALIDVRLPGHIQGEAVSARLRRSPTLCAIPIILMTAYHLPPNLEKQLLQQSSADRLLQKPLPHPQQLQALVTQLSAART